MKIVIKTVHRSSESSVNTSNIPAKTVKTVLIKIGNVYSTECGITR